MVTISISYRARDGIYEIMKRSVSNCSDCTLTVLVCT